MKSIRKIYSLLFALALFQSCNYLDVKPSGMVIPESVSEYRAIMTSGYNLFPKHKRMLAVRSDEAFPYGNKNVYDDYISVALWDESNPGALTPAYPYMQMYNVIFYANTVIEGIDEAAGDVRIDTREQLKAEAYLLRAYSHFELLNLYGKPYVAATASQDRGIPLSLKIDVEQNFVPASVEQTYGQILSDIASGKALVQVEEYDASQANLRYRFTKKAAQALEARVRLYRSEWDLALKAAEELLPCNLEDLNDPDARSPYYYDSKESILALDQVTDSYIVSKGYMYMLPNVMDKYKVGEDLRVDRYFRLAEDGVHYEPNKGSGSDMKVTFRSGEIYLIAAEAAAHVSGKLETAKEYLKELMKHRLTPAYYATKAAEVDAMGQEQLIAEIADERARELALEGHRWYDLRRTTRPEMVKVYTDNNGNQQRAVLTQDDPRYTIRFPKEAIENNPNLN